MAADRYPGEDLSLRRCLIRRICHSSRWSIGPAGTNQETDAAVELVWLLTLILGENKFKYTRKL